MMLQIRTNFHHWKCPSLSKMLAMPANREIYTKSTVHTRYTHVDADLKVWCHMLLGVTDQAADSISTLLFGLPRPSSVLSCAETSSIAAFSCAIFSFRVCRVFCRSQNCSQTVVSGIHAVSQTVLMDFGNSQNVNRLSISLTLLNRLPQPTCAQQKLQMVIAVWTR